MAAYMNLTDVSSPLAQTFNVTEPGGVMLTGVGLYFFSKPGASEGNFPVTVELRPVTEGGGPSAREIYPGTKVVKSKADITASTTYNATTGETKFDFPVPFHVPENTQLALTVSTNAAPGAYKIWIAQLGDFEYGSTSRRVVDQPNVGSFFTSSNGTTWTPEQNRDLTFKVYNAQFINQNSVATLYADTPPPRLLSDISANDNPLTFTSGDSDIKVSHPQSGFQIGDNVRISGLDSATTYYGIFGHSIMGKKTIKSVDPYGYVFAADSAADSSGRGGGTGIIADEQLIVDTFKLNLPDFVPQSTTISYKANMTRGKSYAGNNTPYERQTTFNINNKAWWEPEKPFLIASEIQESDRLSSLPSSVFSVVFNTENVNVAPYININAASLETGHNVIDYADSAAVFAGASGLDSDGTGGRNILTTTPYIAESSFIGGSNAAKFIAKPVLLASPASSIKVLVDAQRTSHSDFEVWYRTAKLGDEINYLGIKSWNKFSTSSIPPNTSNYDDMPVDEDFQTFREYSFSQFSIPDFDVYQIKIVMKSKNSARPPLFQNLRTIATV